MGSNQRRGAAGVVEGFLQRVYQRSGARGVLIIGFSATAAVVLLVTAVIILTFAGYNQKPVATLMPYAAMGSAASGIGLQIGLLASWRTLGVVLKWADGPRSATRAVEAWGAALAVPRVLALRCSVAVFVLQIANNVLIYRGLDLPWVAFPTNTVSAGIMVAAGGVASMLFLEYLLRPLTADVAQALPPDFEPEAPRFALYTKAILPVPGVVLYTALFVGLFADTNASFTNQMTRFLIATIAVTVVAVALYYVLAHAFLDPIEQLTAATHRVHGGDLDTRVPVVSGDEFGSLAVSFNQMLDGLQERERLRVHNTELSTALEESLEEVRASRARIVEAADAERRRMERDLHDGAQQRLVMISLKLGIAAALLEDHPEATTLVQELRTDAARAVDELRDLAHGIYPPLLESDGLASALEDVADQSPLHITVEGANAARYPGPVESAVYFCCLEALQNATKYAGPDCRVTVVLRDDDGMLRFSVADDGPGFETSTATRTAGLQNMADRIGALGGDLCVVSAHGAGTTVEGSIPR